MCFEKIKFVNCIKFAHSVTVGRYMRITNDMYTCIKNYRCMACVFSGYK